MEWAMNVHNIKCRFVLGCSCHGSNVSNKYFHNCLCRCENMILQLGGKYGNGVGGFTYLLYVCRAEL